MKRLCLIIFTAVLFTSCASTVQLNSTTYFFDFREYTEQGLFIYPYHPATINYHPVGQISVEARDVLSYDSWIGGEVSNGQKDIDGAMKQLVKDAKSFGADCIFDFKIVRSDGHCRLSGFAVKLLKE